MFPQPTRVKYLYTVTHSPLIISTNRCTHEVEICLCASYTNPMCIMITCTVRLETHFGNLVFCVINYFVRILIICITYLINSELHSTQSVKVALWYRIKILSRVRKTFPRIKLILHAQPIWHRPFWRCISRAHGTYGGHYRLTQAGLWLSHQYSLIDTGLTGWFCYLKNKHITIFDKYLLNWLRLRDVLS